MADGHTNLKPCKKLIDWKYEIAVIAMTTRIFT